MDAEIKRILDRKRQGTDCTSDESAAIKGYFDTHHPEQEGCEVAQEFVSEADEWFSECERGWRPWALEGRSYDPERD